MRSCEATGKNIEQAIENALFELKASREDVDIKILSEGGFLKKAKVLVTISEDALPKYEKKEELKKQEEQEKEDEKQSEDDFVEKYISKKIEITNEPSKVQIVADEEYVKVNKDGEIQEEKKEYFDKKVDAEEFLKKVLEALDLTAEITKEEDDRFIRYNLKGENLNDLIGRHGECLFALSSFLSSVCRSENRKKVVLDVENYRDKRAETLTNLAKRVASKVAKSGRYYKFEPMDASERKIIHTALQNDDRVTTMSKGEEPHRYLIVFPREYHE